MRQCRRKLSGAFAACAKRAYTERCARRERLTHSLPLVSASRLAHLCRSRLRGSIRKQAGAAGAQVRSQIPSPFVAKLVIGWPFSSARSAPCSIVGAGALR